MIDWTFAWLFPPDIVDINLDSEAALLLRQAASDADSSDAEKNGVPLTTTRTVSK
jgi:hypothetical protein